MTIKDFITGIIKYYGEYRDKEQANIIIEYLKKRYYDSELDKLYRKTIRIYYYLAKSEI